MADPKKPIEDDDTLIMGPDLGNERRPFFRRNSDGIQAGIMSPVKEGMPIPEDSFYIEHQGPGPVYKVTPLGKSKSRPTTREYRKNYDRIFGGKTTVGQA
jgi:hypothetical protein